MRIFILEDDEDRIRWFASNFSTHNLVICNEVEVAKAILNAMKFDAIFLDHDLGGRAHVDSKDLTTCYHVIPTILSSNNIKTTVIIHSWNNVGAKNMMEALKEGNHQGRFVYIPFGTFNANIFYNSLDGQI